jgi:hypothetical protein
MADLARRGEAPHVSGKYYSRIHTVVCINPDIPAGSRLAPYRHVDAVGYRELLDLLTTDGPMPPWGDDHWDAFVRHLQLVPEEPDTSRDPSRRATIATLDDYRHRFAAIQRHDLHEYVPVPARVSDHIVPDPVQLLTEAMTGQHIVTFTGRNGAGKSHATRHAALAVAETGAVPVWVRCGEYQRGRFSHALSRAVAPFTTESWLPLLQHATDTGSPIVVILDGLNECADVDRGELLEQLGALRLRLPVAAVITSTVPVGLPDADLNLASVMLDEDTRLAVLASYGHLNGLVGAEAFQTPMELALAGKCGEQLRPAATATELFDAYITHVCPAETTRAGLRCLAVEMDRQLRGSVTTAEARVRLYRDANTSSPTDIDTVLNSPLVTLTQGRVAFIHELFARFLTAEHLVLEARDTAALAAALRDSRHMDLHAHAVALEHDPALRRELLYALADTSLLSDAVRGTFGNETASAIRTDVAGELVGSISVTADAQLIRNPDIPDGFAEGHWEVNRLRTRGQQALLHVAGTCLADGLFLDETHQLLDATDRRCAEEIQTLRDAGYRTPTSAVVQATYSRVCYTDDRELRKLPASVVIEACDHSRFMRQRAVLDPSPARAMWSADTIGPACWGRLTATLLLVNPNDSADLALLPDAITAAWKANGYHLRLTALMTAEQKAHYVDDTTRERIREALEACDADNIVLNSLLFEALASYGSIEPLNDEESIRTEIKAILTAPDNEETWAAARRVVGMVFEDQNLHGPYAEMLTTLPRQDYLHIHVKAARSSEFPFHLDWMMNAIVECIEHADDDARTVLRDAVLAMDWRSPFREETVGAHLIALRGWAVITDKLPPFPTKGVTNARRAWRVTDELLFALLRGTNPADDDLAALWAELLDVCAPAAVDVLAHLKSAKIWENSSTEPSMYERLLATWPDQTRQLIEWAVRNPDRLIATFDNGPAHHAVRQLVADLANIGNMDTVAQLQQYIGDTELGYSAVTAIRSIKQRVQES